MVNYIHYKGKAELVKPLLDYCYFQFYQKKVLGIQGSPVHDALTLIAVNRDDLFTYYKSTVVINTTDAASGQIIGDFRLTDTPERFDGRPQQRIAIDLDYEGFYREFITVMTGEQF
jgi:purine nucleosidase